MDASGPNASLLCELGEMFCFVADGAQAAHQSFSADFRLAVGARRSAALGARRSIPRRLPTGVGY